MNIEKINKVKEFYSLRNVKRKNKNVKTAPFFTNIMKKLDKKTDFVC